MSLKKVYDYIEKRSENFVKDLVRLVRQPSVSAKGEGIAECAKLVEEMMREAGLSTKILRGDKGNPVVYGEVKSRGSGKTLLFYDHYDVQPPEPLEKWDYDHFGGKVVDGRIYGRGVTDNKGNFVSRLKLFKPFWTLPATCQLTLNSLLKAKRRLEAQTLSLLSGRMGTFSRRTQPYGSLAEQT